MGLVKERIGFMIRPIKKNKKLMGLIRLNLPIHLKILFSYFFIKKLYFFQYYFLQEKFETDVNLKKKKSY